MEEREKAVKQTPFPRAMLGDMRLVLLLVGGDATLGEC